jgi:hypothetical protein
MRAEERTRVEREEADLLRYTRLRQDPMLSDLFVMVYGGNRHVLRDRRSAIDGSAIVMISF